MRPPSNSGTLNERRMPSGKQILLSLLRTYSQLGVEDPAREEATDRLKAGLLLHGSTAEETWAKVERVAWLQADRSQGLGLARTGIGTHAEYDRVDAAKV
jgi:hypothetical protein